VEFGTFVGSEIKRLYRACHTSFIQIFPFMYS
jgi:hypothetical protein